MRAVELVFAVGWASFWLYWLVAAFSAKAGRVAWSSELTIRAVIAVMVILLIRLGRFITTAGTRIRGAPPPDSSSSRRDSDSRSGRACTSDGTGEPR